MFMLIFYCCCHFHYDSSWVCCCPKSINVCINARCCTTITSGRLCSTLHHHSPSFWKVCLASALAILPSHPDGVCIMVTLCIKGEVLLHYLLLQCIWRCNVHCHLPSFGSRKAYAKGESMENNALPQHPPLIQKV